MSDHRNLQRVLSGGGIQRICKTSCQRYIRISCYSISYQDLILVQSDVTAIAKTTL